MSNYLFQAAYTPEAWANMLAQPHDRIDAVRPVIEKLGGKVIHAWFAFGDYDVVAIAEMPTNVEAAAFSLAATAGGAIKAIKTTPLMTTAEGIEAMKKAGQSGYKAPTRRAQLSPSELKPQNCRPLLGLLPRVALRGISARDAVAALPGGLVALLLRRGNNLSRSLHQKYTRSVGKMETASNRSVALSPVTATFTPLHA